MNWWKEGGVRSLHIKLTVKIISFVVTFSQIILLFNVEDIEMHESFIKWKPNKASLEMLNIINNILLSYSQQGYKLTLRQLYYQLVAGDHIPNSQYEYKKLGYVVNKGRLAGFIDWEMIEDRSRSVQSNPHWDSPRQIAEAAVNSYYEDRWNNQICYIEVWCEKDAVSNIIQPVCSEWDVTFMANRGYLSQSSMYEAVERFRRAEMNGKTSHLIYLGDHDPSGIDMHFDIRNRLEIFLKESMIGISRIALTMEQIQTYQPPNNPAKQTDSRFRKYAAVYDTDFSWELDALQPSVLSDIVENEILLYVDMDCWEKAQDLENASKKKLQYLVNKL